MKTKNRKKILFYCQHSSGIGHLVRSFALVAKLGERFDVILLSGGVFPVKLIVPDNIRFIQLSAVGLNNKNFLEPFNSSDSIHEVMAKRRERIISTYLDFQPDVFISEYFPFGKMQFMGELLPLLKLIKRQNRAVLTLCSLRDIMEPTTMAVKMYQDFSIKVCNDYYTGLLIHSDPQVITFQETYPKMDALETEVKYTGYVTKSTHQKTVDHQQFSTIVASFGGGKIGPPYAKRIINAFKEFGFGEDISLTVVGGPLFPEKEWANLSDESRGISNLSLVKSIDDLPSVLRKSRLSVNLGGYNTLMEILSYRIPSLTLPFTNDGNSEQGIRCQKLSKRGLIKTAILENLTDLELAEVIKENLNFIPKKMDLNMDGAESTCKLIEQLVEQNIAMQIRKCPEIVHL